MVADFQTSMKEIRDANLAFVSLLTQLKRFISDKGTIAITVGGIERTLPTIPSVIESYRNGNFDEIVLKSGTSEVHIRNNDGTLQIVDKEGHLVPLESSILKYSALSGCRVDSVAVKECTIDRLEAGGISVNSASCQSLAVAGQLVATAGMFQSLSTQQLSAGLATIQKLAVRSTVFNPAAQADIFVAQSPYNYSEYNNVFDNASGGTHAYVCAPTPSEEENGWKSPSTMGFVELPKAEGNRVLLAPDMMSFQGHNLQSSYNEGKAAKISNCYVVGTGGQGTSVEYSTAQAVKGPNTYCSFGFLLGWPIRSYVKDPPADPMLPPIMQGHPRGIICLHEFSAADIGHIVYIRTFGSKWRIPRRLITTYEGGVLQGGMVDLTYEIPEYTSLRLRLARYPVTDGNKTLYHNVMELT